MITHEHVTMWGQTCATLLSDIRKLVTDKNGHEYAGFRNSFDLMCEVRESCGLATEVDLLIKPTDWKDNEMIFARMKKSGDSWIFYDRVRMCTKSIKFISGYVNFMISQEGILSICSVETEDTHLYSFWWRWVFKPFRRFVYAFRYLH